MSTEERRCVTCDFVCSKQSNFNRHLATRKHQILTSLVPGAVRYYTCVICDHKFAHRQSLHTPKKTCGSKIKDDVTRQDIIIKDLIEKLSESLSQNKELQETIKEIIPKIGNNNNITNTITNNNHIENKFNINIFLNEKCKDAMNISDFVKSIQLQLSDIQNIGQIGYVKGISNIIINQLNNLDIYKRPIHCTDVKRETLYIKDNDTWERENKDLPKIKKAIQSVSNAGFNLLHKLDEDDDNTLQITIEVTGGAGDIDQDKQNEKIISLISKATTVNQLRHGNGERK